MIRKAVVPLYSIHSCRRSSGSRCQNGASHSDTAAVHGPGPAAHRRWLCLRTGADAISNHSRAYITRRGSWRSAGGRGERREARGGFESRAATVGRAIVSEVAEQTLHAQLSVLKRDALAPVGAPVGALVGAPVAVLVCALVCALVGARTQDDVAAGSTSGDV